MYKTIFMIIYASVLRISKLSNVTTSNVNYNAASIILDSSAWEDFVNVKYATSAIGGPTLEMWINSWNQKYTDNIEYDSNSNGYRLGRNGNLADYLRIDYDNSLNMQSYLPENYVVPDNNRDCNGFWLATPSAANSTFMMKVGYYQNQLDIGYTDLRGTMGYRPVVCLNNELIGAKIFGTWLLDF